LIWLDQTFCARWYGPEQEELAEAEMKLAAAVLG
jgi:hypothetical protein